MTTQYVQLYFREGNGLRSETVPSTHYFARKYSGIPLGYRFFTEQDIGEIIIEEVTNNLEGLTL